MANLASTYRNQGRWTEAEKMDVEVMEAARQVLGKERPDTLSSMANLAFTTQGQGRNQEGCRNVCGFGFEDWALSTLWQGS